MYSKELQQLICPKFDESILLEILQKSTGNKQVIITSVEIKDPATNKGDSYLSSVVKFAINGTSRLSDNEEKPVHCSVFVKILPKNLGRRISFRSADFFENEVLFYNTVWTTLLKFQESKSILNKFMHLPICYSAIADGTNDYVALEDLSYQSYVSFKRQRSLDYETIIQIIQIFAKFHALSFAYKTQFPEEFKRLATAIQETYFAEKFRSWYTDFHNSLVAVARDAIEKELPKTYAQKFQVLVENDFLGQLIEISNRKNDKFSVFTQGDAWVPNFLVKYDSNNKPEDIKMIDFQLARCSSPACDISFFLYSSASYELLSTRWDDLMKAYHQTFCTFLTELGGDESTFTWDAFNEDFRKNALLGVGMCIEALPFQIMDDNEAPDLDSIEGDQVVPITNLWKVYPIKTKEGRQRIANMFKHAVDMNFIE